MIHNEHTIQRPFAVVTGVSERFGVELARQFAAKGFDLLITGRDANIHETNEELIKYGIFVESLQVDLSTYNGVEILCSTIKEFGHPVDAIAIYAEEGPSGAFANETELKDEIELIRRNIISPVHLVKRVLKDMLKRGHGRILISSDLTRSSEASYDAVHGATKSFLFSFTESIRDEIRNSSVTITSLLPNLYELPSDAELLSVGNPEELAREGFDALMAGRDHVFSASLKTRLQGILGRLLPEKARTFISTTPS